MEPLKKQEWILTACGLVAAIMLLYLVPRLLLSDRAPADRTESNMTLAEDQTLDSSVLGALDVPGRWVSTDTATIGDGRKRLSFIKVSGGSGAVGTITTLMLDGRYHREARWKWFLVAPGDTLEIRYYDNLILPIYRYDGSALATNIIYPQRVANAFLGHEGDFDRLEILAQNPNTLFFVTLDSGYPRYTEYWFKPLDKKIFSAFAFVRDKELRWSKVADGNTVKFVFYRHPFPRKSRLVKDDWMPRDDLRNVVYPVKVN